MWYRSNYGEFQGEDDDIMLRMRKKISKKNRTKNDVQGHSEQKKTKKHIHIKGGKKYNMCVYKKVTEGEILRRGGGIKEEGR